MSSEREDVADRGGMREASRTAMTCLVVLEAMRNVLYRSYREVANNKRRS